MKEIYKQWTKCGDATDVAVTMFLATDLDEVGTMNLSLEPVEPEGPEKREKLKEAVHSLAALGEEAFTLKVKQTKAEISKAQAAMREAANQMAAAIQSLYPLVIAEEMRDGSASGYKPVAEGDSTHNVLIKEDPIHFEDNTTYTGFAMSNMAYEFTAGIKTHAEDEAGTISAKPIYTVSWALYTRVSADQKFSVVMVNDTPTSSYEAAERLINTVAHREFGKLFTEENPIIDTEHEKLFSFKGVPYPGRRLESEVSHIIAEATAQIELGCPWVTYSNGNDGEPDYYRDVYINGHVAYSHGERCDVLHKGPNFVTLHNPNCDMETFSIPRAQYEVDFVEEPCATPD